MHVYSRSFLALFVALLIHGVLIAALLISNRTQNPVPIKERFIAVSLHHSLPTPPSMPSSVSKKTLSMKQQNTIPLPSAVIPTTNKPTEENLRTTDPLLPITKEQLPDLSKSIQRHYGDEFFTLSAGEQHYILNNLQKIRRINDIVGNRLLQTKSQENLENRDNNYVEFYLHPDGSISELSLQNERTDSLLDELTLETIELAHTQYPKPEQKTLIRIRVFILVK